MNFHLQFPSLLHEQAAERAYEFFQSQPGVDTILVVNSCARGQGIPESDLDMAVLVDPSMPNEAAVRLEALRRQEICPGFQRQTSPLISSDFLLIG